MIILNLIMGYTKTCIHWTPLGIGHIVECRQVLNLRGTLKKSSFIASFGRAHEMSVFDFSIALIAMPSNKSCNASAFCPKVFTTYFLLPFLVQSKRAHTYTHPENTHAHARAQGESQVSIIMIVPSCHMPWPNAEDALFWELDVVLFWNAIYMKFLNRVFKKMFNVQGWGCLFRGGAFIWQSRVYVHKPFKVKSCSFRGGVHSNMFYCTCKAQIWIWA